jgi:predicted enzyme related to lactoylglutathione lyase
MFENAHAFSGFSVNDIDAAKEFYGQTLGLTVQDDDMGLHIKLVTGAQIFVYQKDNHEPATYTMLNFPVDDIEQAVAALEAKGVTLEHYDGMTDDKGIARGLEHDQGPDIAWFKDPAGNILSVLQDK